MFIKSYWLNLDITKIEVISQLNGENMRKMMRDLVEKVTKSVQFHAKQNQLFSLDGISNIKSGNNINY